LLRHDSTLSVRAACRASGVSPSAYYRFKKRTASRAAKAERRLEIQQLSKCLFDLTQERYGVPRVWHFLSKKVGIPVSRFAVEQAFKSQRLVARAGKKRAERARKHQPPIQTPHNMLDRDFRADAPNQRLVTDVTCLKLHGDRKAYACFVKDLYARTIVGWSVSQHHDTALVLAALERALSRPDFCIESLRFVHSDQGSEYTSQEVHKFLSDRGVQQSFSAKGTCLDNASAESFNNTFKMECDYAHARSLEELQKIVGNYVDAFYNSFRSHSYNNQEAPESVRREALAA